MLCFCIRLFRLGKSEAWGAGKEAKKVASPKEVVLKRRGPGKQLTKILSGVQILEVGVYPGDQSAIWRKILGDVQGPWPVILEVGDCKQLHSKN